MPLNVRPLSKALQEKAIRELNEVPSRVEDDVRHIQDWIRKQPHLRARTDDQFILNFLRSCKFSLEKTKEKIDLFYTLRTQFYKYGINRDPFRPDIQKVFNLRCGAPLKRTIEEDGPRIFMARYDGFDPTISFETYLVAASMVADYFINEDDNFIIGGQFAIADGKNAVLDYFWTLDLELCRKLAVCGEYGYPVRPQSLIGLNAPSFYKFLYNIAVPFMSAKVKSRLQVYTDDKILPEILPRSLLPKDYGGDGESFEELRVYWKEKIESYRDYFLEDEQYLVDESKRPGKPKTSLDLFGAGIQGSFRKLDID